MSRDIVVVDVETNGLDPDRHEAVEIAWWNLETGDRGRFVPRHDQNDVLARADVQALRVNRYIDRIADGPHDTGCDELLRLWEQFAGSFDDEFPDSDEEPTANTLAGSNPTFDAAMLRKAFAKLDKPFDIEDVAPWHHRLWDLSAYAAGVLGLDELPGLARVCELLDIDPPDHTAEGDVTATGKCFNELRRRAAR